MAATVAPPPRQRFIPELLVVHAEELSYLWGRRCRSLASATLTWRDLTELSERIEAHTQGLLIAGDALAEVLASWLAGEERDETFAGAYPLLRARQTHWVHRVIAAFR